MGSLGSIVIPLVVAAVIGFVAGWFFARTGERTESAEPDLVSVGRLSGSDESTGALSDAESATFDRRLAQLEADYSQRSDTFVKREAELTAAGRKLVEQLRHRERELGVLREQHEAIDAEAVPVEAVDSEPVDVEPADVAEVAAGSESVPPPVLAISVEPSQIRSRRRSVIDPATGLPLGAEPTVSESTANVDDPQMIGSSPTGESDIQHGGVAKPDPQPPRLSVRMVGPRVRQDDPQIIDLRERRLARQAQKGSDPQRPMAPADGGGPLEVPLDSPDDLTKLVGIGPKIAGELTDAGISSFARLARLDPAGPLPSSLEGLRGRMRRNGWVQQAQALAE